MADSSPKNPGNRGTSPSPSIDRASQQSWDEWHQHGNQDPKKALQEKHTNHPVDPASNK